MHRLLSGGASALLPLPISPRHFVSELRRKCIGVGQMYSLHEDTISRVCWICIFKSSQRESVLISSVYIANSHLDKHTHAVPGGFLFWLTTFRLPRCQNVGHAGMKQYTGFYILLLRTCSLLKLPGFSAKYLSYSLRTACSLPQKNEPEETLQIVPSFQQAGAVCVFVCVTM